MIDLKCVGHDMLHLCRTAKRSTILHLSARLVQSYCTIYVILYVSLAKREKEWACKILACPPMVCIKRKGK